MPRGSSYNEHPPPVQDNLRVIREILIEKSSDDLERELPGLINTVQTQSIASEETIRYVIGVSFTNKRTCLDYWIDRVILPSDLSEHEVRVEKEAINSNHMYVTFCYPPDPEFDGVALRGILLATVEDRIHSTDQEDADDENRPFFKRFYNALRSGYHAFLEEF